MAAEKLLQKWRERAEWAANKAVEARNDNRHHSAEQYESIAMFTKDHSDELEQALQADAREKGEAVFRLYPEELARMTHGPSLRAEEEDRLRSIYGDVAIPLYLHSGDYTEAMLLLEKQRELVENLRGQLDDAKADATDGCTEANCERCNTAIHSRGDMRHAGIGTYPATQPAQASEKDTLRRDLRKLADYWIGITRNQDIAHRDKPLLAMYDKALTKCATELRAKLKEKE